MLKPVVCVLLGDASGVGTEIVVKTFSEENGLLDQAKVVLLGDVKVVARAEKIIGKKLQYALVVPEDIRKNENDLMLVNTGNINLEDAAYGKVSPACGAAVAADIKTACNFYAKGFIDGICFAPFNKEAIRRAGNDVTSELELFRKNCADLGLQLSDDFGELNVVDGLWTTRVTSHIPLVQLKKYLTFNGIISMIRLADHSCRTSGVDRPRIAVSALNPHCGEGGLCGDEEQTLIKPAIRQAQEEGYNVVGMYSPDTIFVHAFNGEADVVVTMYHDQGQIALKLKGFSHAVTVLAGLPMPIGTPAHGTAHDIAGTGRVNESAFITAFGIVARQSLSVIDKETKESRNMN